MRGILFRVIGMIRTFFKSLPVIETKAGKGDGKLHGGSRACRKSVT